MYNVDFLIKNFQMISKAVSAGEVSINADMVVFKEIVADFIKALESHFKCTKSFLIFNATVPGPLPLLGFICMGCGKWIAMPVANLNMPLYVVELDRLRAKGFRMLEVWEDLPKSERTVSYQEALTRIKGLILPAG